MFSCYKSGTDNLYQSGPNHSHFWQGLKYSQVSVTTMVIHEAHEGSMGLETSEQRQTEPSVSGIHNLPVNFVNLGLM